MEEAAALIRQGEPVGMPTETVYGLACDAGNADAVRKVFAAKGRPADNPLIVHIVDIADWAPLVTEIPPLAQKLAERFWPGPLTIILPRTDRIPSVTAGGLDSVGVRFPAHPLAQALIRAAGVPIAAPSGNRSGSPSPTTAAHMMQDMDGRIPAVIEGGSCICGVESTVIALDDERSVRVLRPGFVTPEQLASPKTLHAISGAAFALKEYPDQIDAECARLIRSHTTGRVGMTLCEKLLYLADYIEPLRTWDDCRKLRKDFYSGARKCSGTGQLMRHLDDIIIESYDMTISELISSGGVIASETVASRNDLIIARNSQNEL